MNLRVAFGVVRFRKVGRGCPRKSRRGSEAGLGFRVEGFGWMQKKGGRKTKQIRVMGTDGG